MKNIELEHCIFSDDGEVEIEGVGKISSEEMEHIVAYWLDITSENSDSTVTPTTSPTNWKTELDKVKKCPQAQDSTQDQLNRLYHIANKFGLYDAADFIRR